MAVYDIELWDEIRNVNVRPFPGAFFTIPRFENIARSRHTGVEVGFGGTDATQAQVNSGVVGTVDFGAADDETAAGGDTSPHFHW